MFFSRISELKNMWIFSSHMTVLQTRLQEKIDIGLADLKGAIAGLDTALNPCKRIKK